MNQKSKRFQTRMLTYGVLVVFCLIVIGIFIYSYISRYHRGKLDIKSRYTFSVDVRNTAGMRRLHTRLHCSSPRPP